METFVAAVSDFLGNTFMPIGVCGHHISWSELVNKLDEEMRRGPMVITILDLNGEMLEGFLTGMSLLLTLHKSKLLIKAHGLTVNPVEIENIPPPTLFIDGRFAFMTEKASYQIMSIQR